MIKHLFAALALAIIGSNALAEAPAQAALCVSCHGEASANADWPSLAGQKKGYLIDQLKAFRAGTRSNPSMTPLVTNLSDATINTLAAYYSAQPVSVAGSGDAKLVDKGHNKAAYCAPCHGARGIAANDEWPNLAGQQARYIENQLRGFKHGTRKNSLMQMVVADFKAEDFAALAAYFSQLQP